jgi:hypothetical protein
MSNSPSTYDIEERGGHDPQTRRFASASNRAWLLSQFALHESEEGGGHDPQARRLHLLSKQRSILVDFTFRGGP